MHRIACLLILALAAPAAAQYVDDDQTRDHELQDRRYQQRRTRTAEARSEPAPGQDPESLAARFVKRADELIRDRNYDGERSDRYRIQTDDPRVDPRAATKLLESFHDFFEGFWSGRMELRPIEGPARVFLFYSFFKFNKLMQADWRFRQFRPVGHYRSDIDVITVHTDPSGASNLADTLVHEAAHQLVEQRLLGDTPTPLWLTEGLASYFGFTLRDGDGVFRTGSIGGKSTVLFREGKAAPSRDARNRLATLRKSLRASENRDSLPYPYVIAIDDPARFYGENVGLHYATSWTLVHFLFHGDEGRHAESFVKYLGVEAEGRGGKDAFYATMGFTPEQLDASVTRHLKSLKAMAAR